MARRTTRPKAPVSGGNAGRTHAQPSPYPETLQQAIPDPGRIAAARKVLEEAGVEMVMSCWIDILGSPKTKPVPLSEFENLCIGKGPQFAVHSVTMFPELGPNDPDQIPVPDLDSLVVCPWDNRLAFVMADLFYDDRPYDVCPRLALRRQIAAAEKAGYRFFAGMEPEFILLKVGSGGRLVKAFDEEPDADPLTRLRRQAYGYDLEFSIDAMPFLREMVTHMKTLGWNPKNVVCEGAYSQFELDFDYTDMLGMADRFILMRVMAKEIAKRHGMIATFMPKPAQGDWRNGAHINWSVQSTSKAGVNLFEAGGDWSDLALSAVAGVIKHGVAVTAVSCSTVNSYKGLIGRARDFEGGTITWAPTHIVYGNNNRSAMLRLPQARFAIENRAVDMCVNPYLALAMTCAASLEGIVERLAPPLPVNRSLYESAAVTEVVPPTPLPANLLEAIEGFESDSLAKDVFGPTMCRLYCLHKRDEWNRYHEHVSDWEIREYLRFI